MRRTVFLFVSIILWGFNSYAQEHDENICSENKIARYQSIFQFDETKYNTRSEFDYDVKYYRLEISVDPAVRAITGGLAALFEVRGENFQTIALDLNHNGLTVDSIVYHNDLIQDFTLANYELSISFPSVIPSATLDSIKIYYHGIPEDNGFGSFEQTWHEGAPIIWTLSEPYGARDWWPCKQSLNDKADSIDVLVTNPVEYKAASNGVLVSETVVNDHKTARWKHRHPITAYLVAFAVTNYSAYSDEVTITGGDVVEVLNYVFPEDLAYAQASTPNVLDVIQLYSELFMPYPFKDEKYGHAQFAWGGGMEHQTMSFMVNFEHGLMAHELAHQWFGDYITCGSWHDIWLNEGFATYLDGLTHEYNLHDDGVDFNSWKLAKINSITSYPDGSVYCDDTTSVNRIFSGRLSYNKGAMVVHMIRKKMGDQDFYTALQNYLNDPELANGFAHTSDLKNHLESVCGCSFEAFFSDWVYGEGYPIYHIFFSQETSGIVNVSIEQLQTHGSVDFFEMDVPVKFYGISEDTLVFFNNTVNGETFSFDPGFTVTSAQFDPNHDVVSRNSTVLKVDTFDGENKFYVLPNPTTGKISLTFLEKIVPDKIIVFDEFGKQLLEYSDFKLSSYTFNLDVSSLQSGAYIVTCYKEGCSVSRKIIKL